MSAITCPRERPSPDAAAALVAASNAAYTATPSSTGSSPVRYVIVSGAGRQPKLTTHYPECNESLSAYNVGRHRHTPEIEQVLRHAAGQSVEVIFTPHLVPMDRGILTTAYSTPLPTLPAGARGGEPVKVIGLTGRIGCGKSTVAGLLHERGVATIDADVVSREVRDADPNVRAAILARFETDDPARLAEVVFADAAALADLEAIVHPAVRDRIRDRLEALAVAGTAVAAVEAIKLLESPLRARCDEVWVVACRPEDAMRRLTARGMSAAVTTCSSRSASPSSRAMASAVTR